MNQHECVEQALAEHDDQAERARHIVGVLTEIERCIGLLAEHVDCGSYNARHDLTSALDNLRRAVRKVEDDL